MTSTSATVPTSRSDAPLRWSWLWIGASYAVFLIVTQAIALGGMAGLLLVGETSSLRPFIEQQLGEVPLVDGIGHDGQIYFAIANDLDGDTVGELIENPGIRFRRLVLPVLASLGGLLSGSAVLWATAGWIALGTGVATMSFRWLIERIGASPRWMVPLFVYPGFWLGVRLFTPDMIALGAAMLGLVLYLKADRSYGPALTLFTVAGLTKEAFLLVPLALAASLFFEGRRLRGVVFAGIPLAAFVGWVIIVLNHFDVGAVDGNFGMPFTGILEARSYWPLTPVSDQIYVYLTMVVLMLSIGVLFAARSALVRWLIVPWPLLAIISSEWIWWFGNGLLRSFAPVVLFMTLALAERFGGRPITASL